MKNKPLILFKILEKYKYLYFVISSLVMATIVVLVIELVNEVGDFTLKHLFNNFFYYWGFMYPASFVAYEAARKQNKKEKLQ